MDKLWPAQRGFRMPAEWLPHAATILSWPHNLQTWPENLHAAQREFAELVAAIADDEPVILLAIAELHETVLEQLKSVVRDKHCIELLDVPTNDAWIRDYGPTFVSDGNQLMAIDWRYNAWGGKYPPFDDDQKCVHRLSELQNIRGIPFERFSSRLCLEGGAVDVDDNGVVMCTYSCALDPQRNSISKLEIENELKNCLGVSHVIWLTGDAIAGDDTEGHIDQLARFAPNRKVLFSSAAKTDSQYDALNRNQTDLESGLIRIGLDYELVELPLPERVVPFGNRLPASYCNFYITNKKVIVPTFNQPSDANAIQILEHCYPGREIVGVPSTNLSVGLGSFHCLTQQIPCFNSKLS